MRKEEKRLLEKHFSTFAAFYFCLFLLIKLLEKGNRHATSWRASFVVPLGVS